MNIIGLDQSNENDNPSGSSIFFDLSRQNNETRLTDDIPILGLCIV